MNVVLLSGGSGKRLWPLSNDIRSKQFIKIFKKPNGEYESMIQNMYNSIKNVDKDATITIATSKNQVLTIKNQIKDDVTISIEPCCKDTFPAIVLATSYLHDVKKIDLNESLIVCPVDQYFDNNYILALKELYELSKDTNYNLSLLGIVPTYPSEKYGYIIPENKLKVSSVKIFKEKPDKETAEQYIKEGALWNCGIFAYKVKYVLDIAHKLIDFDDYYDLLNKYETLEKRSFDYAVVEKEKNIQVMRINGEWKDLGTWNTLTETMDEDTIGNVIKDETCENLHVINELNIQILCMGLQDMVVAASSKGIIVSDKKQSSYMKPYVEKINQQSMFAEKSWGSYKVIDVQEESLTIVITLNSGDKMKYHSHDYRNEVWTVISGKGKTIVDGMEQFVKPGDVITIEAGCKHTIIAETELKVIEVQLGKEINVDDKHEYIYEE